MNNDFSLNEELYSNDEKVIEDNIKKEFIIDYSNLVNIRKIIIFISIFIIITFILILIYSSKNEYKVYEKILEDKAYTYSWLYNIEIDKGQSKTITLDEVKRSHLLYYNEDIVDNCDGYVVIKNNRYKYRYKAYIQCGDYRSKGYNANV